MVTSTSSETRSSHFATMAATLGVRLRKLSGGYDKPLDFRHLSRIMVVEQLDVADVRGISTGANDRGPSYDLRLIEDRVAMTADNEVNVVHRFSQSTVSTVAGMGQEDDDIDIGSDRVNDRTDGRDLPVESHSFVAPRRGDFSGSLRRDTDDADAQILQVQRCEGASAISSPAGPRAFALSRGKSAISR